MAKFLTTVGNSFYIEQIILNAEKDITIVTPFLKLSQTLIDRINDAERADINITFIYGKSELIASQRAFLYSLKNLRIYFYSNLHAKCYHNERQMVISSMNLYEFSERNNREMGVLIEKDQDSQMFDEAVREIESIKNASTLEKEFENKSGGKNSSEKMPENYMSLDPDFTKNWNFHLPAFETAFKRLYPRYRTELTETAVIVYGFPFRGIEFHVSGRMDLKFDDDIDFELVKRRNAPTLPSGLPGIRFFWNNQQVNIYPESGFNPGISEEGLKLKVDKFITIVEYVRKTLKI